MRLTMIFGAGLVAAGLVVSGCGGGSGSNSSGASGSSVSTEAEAGGSPSGEGGQKSEEGSTVAEGEASGSGGSGSPDRSTFINEATAICKDAREGAFERIAAYEKRHGAKNGTASVQLSTEAIRAVLISTIGNEIAGIEALSVPAGDEQEVEAMISEMRSTLDKAKADKKLAYNEIEESFAAADKKLEAYGLESCTKNGQG